MANEQNNLWTPIRDGLPKVPDLYLVTTRFTFDPEWTRIVKILHSDEWEDEYSFGTEVIAWMPLPESYQGESPDFYDLMQRRKWKKMGMYD